MLRHVCLVPQLGHSWPVILCLGGNSEQPGPAPDQLSEPIVMIGYAGCSGRREDGERGQELRTVD
jgi:hypothetical protein